MNILVTGATGSATIAPTAVPTAIAKPTAAPTIADTGSILQTVGIIGVTIITGVVTWFRKSKK